MLIALYNTHHLSLMNTYTEIDISLGCMWHYSSRQHHLSLPLSLTNAHTNTDQRFFGMYLVDDSATLTCSISGATRFEWLLGGQIVASTAILSLTVNDSIHHNLYICQGHNSTSLVDGLGSTGSQCPHAPSWQHCEVE